MTISDAMLSAQIIRLANAFVNRPPSVDEHKKAYRERAKSLDHATRMTARLIETCKFFPSPAEIYAVAEETLLPEDMPQPDKTCAACDGTGWAETWILFTRGELKSTVTRITEAQAAELRPACNGWDLEVETRRLPCTECSYGQSIRIATAQRKNVQKADKGLQRLEPPPLFGSSGAS